ncbi:unnamed protein product [Cylicocyclus nassatus]|uniref:SCP domain-containing protein n=1 Tax=Cylicocyclus nassatus TaxID=53992 RepID=A0AA36M8K3_CYLNA|nr:unnamed protein product [Cylicocyclus nassatus]
MPSLQYHVVVIAIFTLLAVEVLCEEAKFPGNHPYDKMCGYNTEMNDELRSQLALGKVRNVNGPLSAASNMIKLEWDCCLERNATEYVRTCPREGSKENQRDPRVGELYARVSVSAVLAGDFKAAALIAVKSWWKVARDVPEKECIEKDAKFQKNFVGKKIESFTQMAWAKTTKLGCAVGRCKFGKNEDYVVVCRYFPKGNKENEYVYRVGRACSPCPNGYACTTSFDCDQQNCQGLCI